MSAFLFRLGRSSARHPFRVLGLWIVIAIAIVALQGAGGGQFVNRFRVPGAESQHAADVLNERFPSHGGQTSRIVLHTDHGRLDDATHAATVRQVRDELAHGHDVAGVAPGATSPDGKTSYLDVAYAVDKLGDTAVRRCDEGDRPCPPGRGQRRTHRGDGATRAAGPE